MSQRAHFYVILKKLHPSASVSAHFPNALPTQRLGNLRVTHQAQVTRRGLSYKVVFFSSVTIPRDTFNCENCLELVWDEGKSEGLFDKEPTPTPPEIYNSTAPPSALGTILRLVFSTPPIGQKTFPLSGTRFWRLVITCNQPLIIFLWLKLLLLTHCLRDRPGDGMVLIAVLWYHRIRMSLPSKMAGYPKAFTTSTYS